MNALPLDVAPAVRAALDAGGPVVALESTLIAHGLPWPVNLETALAAERAVREVGAVPATIAVLEGRPTVGLTGEEVERLAKAKGVRKASSRDLGAAVAQRATAATTVSATMRLAHLAGIRVFATGGIGGVHRGEPPHPPAPSATLGRGGARAGSASDGAGRFDVSADLVELGRTPVCVVCAGAKSILDLPSTLEVLETQGVPVVGYRTDEFPAFYLPSSGLPVSARVDSPGEAAALLRAHWAFHAAGVVLARPLPAERAVDPAEFDRALSQAEEAARQAGVGGPALTPFLLARLAELTGGKTLKANQALIVANAALAAEIARALRESS